MPANPSTRYCGALAVAALLLILGLLYCLLRPGPVPPSPLETIPTATQGAQLVQETTARFGEAIRAGDLSLFRAGTSPAFRKAFSAERFEQAFGGFVEQRTNLLAAARQQPVLGHPPALTADGTLLLHGYFPTRPSRVLFDYRYLWEGDRWMLSGIDVSVRPVTQE